MTLIDEMSARSGRYVDDTSTVRNIIERVTGSPSVIQTDHKYIHVGIAYKAHLNVDALAAAASESYSLKTPAAKYLHLKNLRLQAMGASVKVEIMRGTTANPLVVAGAGDAASELTGPHNVNDTVASVTGVVIKKTPTYTDDKAGEVWDYVRVNGDTTNQFVSTSDAKQGENFEWVLKPDTYYVIKFTNLSAGGGDAASGVELEMFWYEEDDG
jgi:hypothetical protein